MMGREKDECQIDGGCSDLHSYGVCEVAGGSVRIVLARESGRQLQRGWSGRACAMRRHSMPLSPIGPRYVRPLGPSVPGGPSPACYSSATCKNGSRRVVPGDSAVLPDLVSP